VSTAVFLLTVASCTKNEGTTAGQKSSRRVYLCDKSLPFVRRKCLGFRRHLCAVYLARVSCASLARDSWESMVDNTLFPAEKRAKPVKPTQGDSSCLGQSQISTVVRVSSSAFPLLTLASNYNVTFRQRRRQWLGMPTKTMRACDLSRPAYCRDIFSPNLAFLERRWRVTSLRCEIRLWAKAPWRRVSRERTPLFSLAFLSLSPPSLSLFRFASTKGV